LSLFALHVDRPVTLESACGARPIFGLHRGVVSEKKQSSAPGKVLPIAADWERYVFVSRLFFDDTCFRIVP
jgi:hypothetical protein